MNQSGAAESRNIHATGLVLDGAGILIRGPSGAGKSLLALELLDRAAARGGMARLVADDRVDLVRGGGGLIMRPPPAIAGKIELRGRGIVHRPYLASAPVHLVVDLVEELVRLLDEDAFATDLMEAALPRCPVPRRGVIDSAHQMLLIAEALAFLDPVGDANRQEFT